METDVPAKKKEPSKRAGAKKKTTAKSAQTFNSDDDDVEMKEKAPLAAKNKGAGRKADANAKTTKLPAAAMKQEPAVKLGEKLLNQMLESAENPGISLERKVRKIRASPFNKKSGSILGRVGFEGGGNEGKMMSSASSETTEEETAGFPPARGRSQRVNRTQVRYVVSDSDSEPVAEDWVSSEEDGDFDEEDGEFDED